MKLNLYLKWRRALKALPVSPRRFVRKAVMPSIVAQIKANTLKPRDWMDVVLFGVAPFVATDLIWSVK